MNLGDRAAHYTESAPDAPHTVVLLHGGFVTGEEWAPQLDDLSARWHVVVPDLSGHGRSDPMPHHAYSVEQWAVDTLALIDDLGAAEVVVVGHSLGGMVAQQMARMRPEVLGGVMLVDTTYSTSSTFLEKLQTGASKVLFRVLSIERLASLSAQQLGAYRPDVGPFIERQMLAFAGDKERFRALWRAVFDFDSRPWLRQLDLPVHLVVASDNKATRRQAVRMLELLPRATSTVLPMCGHMLHWDRPEAFNAEVHAFLDAVYEVE